jgi:hypothetical protein
MIKDSNRMLLVSIAFAVLIHAILLFTVKFKSNLQTQVLPPILTVLISKSTGVIAIETQKSSAISLEHKPIMIKSANKHLDSDSKVDINFSESVLGSTQLPVEKAIMPNEQASIEQTNSHAVVMASKLQSILESAKEIANEDGRQLGKKDVTLNNAKPSGQNALSAAIGSTFKRNVTSEQKEVQHADGTIQVVTAYGTKCCLTPTKSFEKGGPVEAQGIPMTCP